MNDRTGNLSNSNFQFDLLMRHGKSRSMSRVLSDRKYQRCTRGARIIGEIILGPAEFLGTHGVSRHRSPRCVCSVCAPSSHSCICIPKDIVAALHGRTRLTNCLCLSPAIFSLGYYFAERDRPNEQAK